MFRITNAYQESQITAADRMRWTRIAAPQGFGSRGSAGSRPTVATPGAGLGAGAVGQVVGKGRLSKGVLLLPVCRNLRDVDLTEWGTGGDGHLEDPLVISGR